MATASCDCDPWLSLIAHGHNSTIPDLMDTATLLMHVLGLSPESFRRHDTEYHPAARRNTNKHTNAQATLSVLLAVLLAVVLMNSNHDEISTIIKDTITVTTAETKILLNDWSFSIDNGKEFRINAHRNENNPPAVPNFIALCLLVVGTIIGLQSAFAIASITEDSQIRPVQSTRVDVRRSRVSLPPWDHFSSYTFSVSTLEPSSRCTAGHSPHGIVIYSPVTQTDARLLVYAFRYRSIVGLCCAAIRSTLLAAVTTFNATVVEKQDGTDNSELAKQILALSQIESYQLPLPSGRQLWALSRS
ncbi:hypothetical protein B0H13DRAFT_2659818 [Mycena leptocephala]|nr:hypothetical protein B0H13DRAFT_2659818 [Mycena leptocephala]